MARHRFGTRWAARTKSLQRESAGKQIVSIVRVFPLLVGKRGSRFFGSRHVEQYGGLDNQHWVLGIIHYILVYGLLQLGFSETRGRKV